MQRIEIIRIKLATDTITGTPEIKSTLDGKQIYSLVKLNKKAAKINDRTNERRSNLVLAFQAADKQITDDEGHAELKKQFDEDIKSLYNEDVEEFEVEKKIPFESSEKILQLVNGSDITNTLIEYLIEEPKEVEQI